MRVTIEKDDETKVVFADVLDLYLAVRQVKTVAFRESLTPMVECTSYSWGSNLRELVKEVTQSIIELQDFLRSQRETRT